MNTFDYKKYVYNNPLLTEVELEENTDAEKAMLAAMTKVGKAIDAAEDKVKPSPKDKEVNEVGCTISGGSNSRSPRPYKYFR